MKHTDDSNVSASVIVDFEDHPHYNEIHEMDINFENYVHFRADENRNIMFTIIKENFSPGIDFLKHAFQSFASQYPREDFNFLCEKFILYLLESYNFYEGLKEYSFSRNSRNIIIENPIAFLIFLRIPEEKLQLFQNSYRVEEFEEGQHLFDERKKDKVLPVLKVFAENWDFDFLYNFSVSSDEYKESVLKIFGDMKNQNANFYKIIESVLEKVEMTYEKFLILFSVVLNFTAGLHTSFQLIDQHLQVEIFSEDSLLIGFAWAHEYQLMLSYEGKRMLSNDEINEYNSKFVKYIYLKYNPYFKKCYQYYNRLTDDQDCQVDHSLDNCFSCSNFRNIDKIRLLYRIVDDLINFESLKKFKLYLKTTFKRDMSNYKHKTENFCGAFSSPIMTKGIKNAVNLHRNTFGESVAYYFLWMSHLMKWIVILSLLSVLFYYIPHSKYIQKNVIILSTKTLDKIYTFIFVIWISLYVRSWKGLERKSAKKWGVREYFLLERDREKFKCDNFIKINSVKVPVQSKYKIFLRYFLSFTVTLLLIATTVYFLTVFQNFQSYLQNKTKDLDMIFFTIPERFKTKLISWGTWVPLFISIYIKLFAWFYDIVCKWLTDVENHQKQENYNNSYIIKNFIFGIVNEYYTFYYIIFFLARKECDIKGHSCSSYLAFQLRTIFYTNLTINLIKETLKPMLTYVYNNYKIRKFLEFKLNKDLSTNDIQFKRYINDNRHLICKDIHSVVGEYEQIIKIYGYVCQFGCLDPSFFFLFAIFVYIQRSLDAFKLIRFYNLTAYYSSSGIGIYNKIIKLFSYLSIFINVYVIYFIKYHKDAEDNPYLFYDFLAIQNLLFVIVYFADFNFLPEWYQYFSAINFDFSKNLMLMGGGNSNSVNVDIYNSIGLTAR